MRKSSPSARTSGSWCTAGLLVLLLSLAAPSRAQVFYLTAGSGGSNSGGATTSDDALTRIDYDGNNPVVIASAITGSPFLLALDGDATRAFVYESVPANRSIKVLNMSTGALIRSFAVNGNVTAMRYDASVDYLYYLTAGPDGTAVEAADALSRVRADGTGTQLLRTSLAADPQQLVLNVGGGELYFYENVPDARAIIALSLASFAPTRTTAVAERVTGLEYDQGANFIYYLTAGVTNAQNAADALLRFRPDGSAAALVASAVTNSPRHLGLDAGNNRAFIYEGQTVSRGIRVISLTTGAQIGNYPVGSDITALVTPTVATVVTGAASALTATSATLGGTVTQTGGAGVTERGVVYSATNAVPAIGSATQLVLGSGTGNFSGTASGLTLSTTYYVRAYATSTAGTAYSSVVPFTTTGPVAIWNGSVSTDWFDANNWTGGVPTPTLDAQIPAGAPRYPLLTTGTPTAKTLNLDADGQLNQTGATLDLKGAFVTNGAYTATGGTVALSGVAPQAVGGAREARFWNLSVGATGAALSGPAALQRVLTLGADLNTNGRAFTLLSGPGGTALVVNSNGVVNGNATVQRYLDPRLNAGPGYRHYSAPVRNTTVADLATAGFAPVLTPAYNTSPTPGTVTPFPTVYGYDQARLATVTNNLTPFDQGWFSLATPVDALAVGRGYTVHLGSGELVDFVGTLNNGDQTVGLSRNAGATAATAGWALLGNPYPAPLALNAVAAADRANLDAASYVFETAGPYTGQYRTYVNGLGGNPVVPLGQGFFVRVSTGQTGGSFAFRNSQRLTGFDATTMHRTADDLRPQVQLALQAAVSGLRDNLCVYFEAGATAGPDAQFDAVKLPNTTGLNLAAQVAGAELAIDGRPLPVPGAPDLTVPLAVRGPASGAYILEATQLLNLPAGTRVYLRDRLAGALIDLQQQPRYTFALDALATGPRFELLFAQQAGVLGPVATSLARRVALYPNPATASVTVEVPAALRHSPMSATLLDGLGRAVLRQQLPAGTAEHRLLLAVPAGVYSLRLQTPAGVVVEKLVVN